MHSSRQLLSSIPHDLCGCLTFFTVVVAMFCSSLVSGRRDGVFHYRWRKGWGEVGLPAGRMRRLETTGGHRIGWPAFRGRAGPRRMWRLETIGVWPFPCLSLLVLCAFLLVVSHASTLPHRRVPGRVLYSFPDLEHPG